MSRNRRERRDRAERASPANRISVSSYEVGKWHPTADGTGPALGVVLPLHTETGIVGLQMPSRDAVGPIKNMTAASRGEDLAMPSRIIYSLTSDPRDAKAFKSMSSARAAAKRYASRHGLSERLSGGGNLGGGRYVAYVASEHSGRYAVFVQAGWLKEARERANAKDGQ